MGYQMAVSLWVYEGTLIWSKYNAMLVANSVVLAVIGFASGSTSASPTFKTGLPKVGILLCLFWLFLTKRGFDNYVYWILSARELEENYLPEALQTVARGGKFADGSAVQLHIDGRNISARMSRVSRLLRAAWASYLVILCFLALYILVML